MRSLEKKDILTAALKRCSSGYQFFLAINVKKTITTAATKYCKTGNLNNNRCETVSIIAATKHNPIKDLIKSLYYNHGKKK